MAGPAARPLARRKIAVRLSLGSKHAARLITSGASPRVCLLGPWEAAAIGRAIGMVGRARCAAIFCRRLPAIRFRAASRRHGAGFHHRRHRACRDTVRRGAGVGQSTGREPGGVHQVGRRAGWPPSLAPATGTGGGAGGVLGDVWWPSPDCSATALAGASLAWTWGFRKSEHHRVQPGNCGTAGRTVELNRRAAAPIAGAASRRLPGVSLVSFGMPGPFLGRVFH